MPAAVTVRVQSADFDVAKEADLLRANRRNVGAIVTFTGICRDEDGALAALELEHYPGMAEAELRRVADDAAQRWMLSGITIVHRHGRLLPGDNIVVVVTAAEHRGPALRAAEFTMDFLKTRAPFWKKEHPASGEAGTWIEAKRRDDDAARRWEDAGPDQPTISTSENQ